jgi:hypothetical protein
MSIYLFFPPKTFEDFEFMRIFVILASKNY